MTSVSDEIRRRIAEKHMFYHVTFQKNLDGIIAEGLRPMRGRRSEKIGLSGEGKEGVFLFVSAEDMEDALMNWLGEEMEEEHPDDELVVLGVTLPDDTAFISEAGYEIQVLEPIRPACIEYLGLERNYLGQQNGMER